MLSFAIFLTRNSNDLDVVYFYSLGLEAIDQFSRQSSAILIWVKESKRRNEFIKIIQRLVDAYIEEDGPWSHCVILR